MYSCPPMRLSASGYGQTMTGEQRSLNSELWHACAGPLVSVPPVGSRVVYFPQGHSEQVAASTQKEADVHIPSYPNLPSRLICLLDNVTLHADMETDEVYTRMTLIPMSGQQEKEPLLVPDIASNPKQPTDFFCKTLTASDTSTHGGFSIPRRAAEKVFPPLDYSQQPPAHPAQELVARDLHDQEWHFRHIYRGQPRRHLLTTGWSVFVSAKRLQAGDSVLFIRDDKGQLLLGIRRANRQQTAMPSSVLTSDSMHIGVLAAANHAAATNSRFTIFYNPRASPSEFVIPLAKYNKAVYSTQVSVGMRFRMVFETEESGVRRYMGTITGIGDVDPIRWPNSHWRSLKVGWDESTAGERQRRVSLWEIEPLTTPFLICPPLTLRAKRPRASSRGHSGMSGEDEEVDGSVKKSPMWLRDDGDRDGLSNIGFRGLGMDPWTPRLPQSPDSVTPGTTSSEFYRVMAAAALQEIRANDTNKQMLQRQSQQSMQNHPLQFRPQQQQPQLQQQEQQQLNIQQQQQQQQQHQQQQSLQPPQPMQLPDVTGPLLQLSSSRPQSPMQLPPLRASSGYTESEVHLSPASTASGSFPLQSLLSRTQQGSVLTSEDTNQFSNLLRTSQSAIQQAGMLPGSGLVGRDSSVSSAWFSTAASDSQAHPSSRMGRADSSPSSAPTFALSSNEPCQSGLTALPMQNSPFGVFRDSSQEQDQVQSDPRSHLLFGVSIDQMPNGSGLGSRGFGKGKDAQARFAGGSLLPGPYCSSSGSDLPISPGMISHGNPMDDGGFGALPRGGFMPPVTSPQRSYTKVYKLGSVGRSLDVARFNNYGDLRAHLARMFGLEGQLEDPQRSGWQLVFVDNEGDVLLVGDDPWDEFVNCVRSIRILSPSEVMHMSQEGLELLNIVPPSVPRPTSSGSEDGATMPAGFEKSCGNEVQRGGCP